MAFLHRQAIARADFARHRTACAPSAPSSILPLAPPPHRLASRMLLSPATPSLSPLFSHAFINQLSVPHSSITLSLAASLPLDNTVTYRSLQPHDREPAPAVIPSTAMSSIGI